ncbi:EamA family transporter, partial [uncultured Gimesia sp.]|uniref:EamA family transporter n=1 Tax=uncultured Gimesia sp. TaxID=1678688 RepID=UPI0034520198
MIAPCICRKSLRPCITIWELILRTTPLFGTVVAAVWLGERFTFNRLIGFVLGFAGVVVLVGWRPFEATPAFFLAVAA